MKPFNVEEAKAGKPVCTRDGRDVRLLCFFMRSPQPLVGVMNVPKENEQEEMVGGWCEDGKYYEDVGENSIHDLFMKDVQEVVMGYAIYNEDLNIFENKIYQSLDNARHGMMLSKLYGRNFKFKLLKLVCED